MSDPISDRGPDLDRDPIQALDHVRRLARDVKAAASTLSHSEARFLVDLYYQLQDSRIRSSNQTRTLMESGEPHQTLAWFMTNSGLLERQIKTSLGVYSDAHVVGAWSQTIIGIGPVLASGLLAHIDITKAPTAGHIWRFAGLDASVRWPKKDDAAAWVKAQDASEDLTLLLTRSAQHFGRNLATLQRFAKTRRDLGKTLARRPWNADLKVLCWKIGESFVKVKSNDDDVYGHLYEVRKAKESIKNDAGDYADQAAHVLATKRIGKDTDAYASYAAGKLPPGHLHARAKRWTVKLFLSHWQAVAYRAHYGVDAPKPYILTTQGGHAHEIRCPNWPF
jgi:hypothetical protein